MKDNLKKAPELRIPLYSYQNGKLKEQIAKIVAVESLAEPQRSLFKEHIQGRTLGVFPGYTSMAPYHWYERWYNTVFSKTITQ